MRLTFLFSNFYNLHQFLLFRIFLFPQSGPAPLADVRSLTHYGEPYDGNTRYFRSTLFVAAVRSCYDESCLLHGVDWMPPKVIIKFALLLGYDHLCLLIK